MVRELLLAIQLDQLLATIAMVHNLFPAIKMLKDFQQEKLGFNLRPPQRLDYYSQSGVQPWSSCNAIHFH